MERHDGDGWQPADHRLVTLGGQRSGATVEFVLRLERPAGQRLSVEGRFELRPHATLIAGHWIETDGASAREGEVASAAIEFLGGQGGRPALGGQYTLSAAGEPVYRINLPSTPLSTAR